MKAKMTRRGAFVHVVMEREVRCIKKVHPNLRVGR